MLLKQMPHVYATCDHFEAIDDAYEQYNAHGHRWKEKKDLHLKFDQHWIKMAV